MSAVDLAEVVVARRDSVALAGVSLQVDEGEGVGVLGHNGAGKTTLLKVINGLVRPDSGRVVVLGREGTSRSWRSIRNQVAYVPQVRLIDSRVPVRAREVVLMGRYGRLGLLRRPGPDDFAAARRALAGVGAEHVAGEPFGLLSGGEQQRVVIAKALAQDARLLLLDEPTNSLDGEAQQSLRAAIRRAREHHGFALVLVSHDVDALVGMCDRIVVLRRGRIAEDRPAAAFGASAPVCGDGGFAGEAFPVPVS